MTMDWSGWGFHAPRQFPLISVMWQSYLKVSIRIYEGGIQLHLVNESHHEQAKSQRRNHHRAWRPEQDPCLRAQTACRFSHFPFGISTLNIKRDRHCTPICFLSSGCVRFWYPGRHGVTAWNLLRSRVSPHASSSRATSTKRTFHVLPTPDELLVAKRGVVPYGLNKGFP